MVGTKKEFCFNFIQLERQKNKNLVPSNREDNTDNKILDIKGYKKRPYYYMYNRDKSILYYSSQRLSDYNLLGIHFFTLKTHLKKGTYYLGKYSFSKNYIDSAKRLKMSFFDVESRLIKDRMPKKKK